MIARTSILATRTNGTACHLTLTFVDGRSGKARLHTGVDSVEVGIDELARAVETLRAADATCREVLA